MPSKVAKNIGTDILIASAHLSVLASQGKIKISQLKVGGSPLYFLPGQEDKLYQFAAGNINPKELTVLDRLKEERVLREIDLDLLSKVALRSLKDFATPLYVTVKSKREVFWRWHLLSTEDTKQAIGEILSQQLSSEESPEVPESSVQSMPLSLEESEPQPLTETNLANTSHSNEISSRIAASNLTVTAVKAEERKLEKQKKLPLESKKRKLVAGSLPAKKNDQPAGSVEESSSKPTPKPDVVLTYDKTKLVQDALVPVIKEYLSKLEIAPDEVNIVRRNYELNLKVKVPSVVGKMVYFCKAKKKHRIDEKDLAAAYLEAQIHKLPLMFLYTSQITKKAERLLETEAFPNTIVKKVE